MPELTSLSPREAATELGLPLVHAGRLIRRDELAAGPDGRITRAELDAFAARRAAASAYLTEAFARKDSAVGDLIARGAGVNAERARELGF